MTQNLSDPAAEGFNTPVKFHCNELSAELFALHVFPLGVETQLMLPRFVPVGKLSLIFTF